MGQIVRIRGALFAYGSDSLDAIMTKILEMEQHARDIVRDAEQQRDGMEEIIAAEKAQLRQSLIQREEGDLAREREEILQKAQAEAFEHRNRTEQKVQAMEQFQESKQEEWIEELYKRIVTG